MKKKMLWAFPILYLKAFGNYFHGGGAILEYDSSQDLIIQTWINQGAKQN
ncbi:MAG: hypothetical protein ACI9TV_000139 [Sulfurimonas sp.]|jgi:hypothetical protein